MGVERMKLEEKVLVCSGRDSWHTKSFLHLGIESVMVADGPHGLRKQVEGADMLGVNQSVPATCFPTASALACSFDVDLVKECARAIAREAMANEVSVVLGPGVNIKRDPLCGRNFEYFSEDAFLSGKLGAAFVLACEQSGVGTCLKHFACNNQEYMRFSGDSVLDERTLREIYLRAFEIAIKEGQPASVMCAYNKVNGVHASDNKFLLEDVLRGEWGFEGIVMSDWGAMHDRINGFLAGCDLNMPGGSNYMEREVIEAVRDGKLPEEVVDKCARRVLGFVKKAQQLKKSGVDFDMLVHDELACKIAENCAVLLKNEGALPLKQQDKVCFVGHMAKLFRFQGAGSSRVNATKTSNPLDFAEGVRYAHGCYANGSTDEHMLNEAAAIASECQTAVVFAGLPDAYESEGFDRQDMMLPEGHIRMIKAVASACEKCVVVLACGSVVDVSAFVDEVDAILLMGLGGQAAGRAAVNLLYGKANPCGKLSQTWAKKYEDYPTSKWFGSYDAHYHEGVFVGYRYFDKAEVCPAFAFGYGLSYTQFLLSDAEFLDNKVAVTVQNIGALDGAEVVQVYVAPPKKNGLPVRELRGFAKVFLRAQQSVRVEIELDENSFCVYDGGFKKMGGRYLVQVGTSSRDIAFQSVRQIEGEDFDPCAYIFEEGFVVKEQSRPVLAKGSLTMNNTLNEIAEFSLFARFLRRVLKSMLKRAVKRAGIDDTSTKMMLASSLDCALSALQNNSQMKNYLFFAALDFANGKFFCGIKHLFRSAKIKVK